MTVSSANFDLIVNSLGAPYYKREGVALYCGDCVEVVRRLAANSVDLIVTSPPYNIGKEYESIRPLSEYLTWCTVWLQLLHQAASANASFWLNLGYFEVPGKAKALPIAYLLWDKSPFYLLQEIVWNYGAGVAARTMFSPRNEKFLWYVKDPQRYFFNLDAVRDPDVKYPNQKKNGKLKCNPLGKNPSDVWQIPKVTSGENRSSSERTDHPAQFPTALIERIVKACSAESQVVLDPFMGSGSTALAAIRNGRFAIGIEVNRAYVQLAADRLDTFFDEEAAKLAQHELSLGV